jgi:hypothetical protein
MVTLAQFVKTHSVFLPHFIKTDRSISQYDRVIDKPFKDIGLKNCFEKIGENRSVVFTSDNNDGFWDLVTMSERGIRSCQSWNCVEHRDGLIGVLRDPYVGIVYLTNKTPHPKGTTMLKRALVRYVYFKSSPEYKDPSTYNFSGYYAKRSTEYKKTLFIERVYSNNPGPDKVGGRFNNIDNDLANTRAMFLNFLRKKSPQMHIVFGNDLSLDDRHRYGLIPLNNNLGRGCVDSALPTSDYVAGFDKLV